MPGHGVLLVGVPPLEDWVRARTATYDTGFVSADPAFAHAHITILAPFPADAVDEAAGVAGAVAPFDFLLERGSVFSDGVVHLVPEPADGFRALTTAARRLLPGVRPYWGRFEPEPHLTLDRLGPHVTASSTLDAVAHLLPARSRATELLLTWWETDDCHVLGRFPLRGRQST